MGSLKRLIVLSLILMSFSAWAAHNSKAIQFGYGDHTTPPFVFHNDDGVLTDGITFKLGNMLGTQLARSVNFIGIPRTRMVQLLIEGDIDLYCFIKSEWVSGSDRFLWSDSLLTETSVFLIHRKQGFSLISYDDLRQKHIGTIRGFKYSTPLMEMFKHQDAFRDDSTTLMQNFDRLKYRRIDTLLGSDILLRFILKTNPKRYPFKLSGFSDSTDQTGCVISPTNYQQGVELIHALEKIKDSGALDNVLNEYR